VLLNKNYNNSLEIIKYIAIVSMFIDHIGLIFYNDVLELRFIGRFALIGFSFVLAHNYRYHTHNKRAYKIRLLKWAMISQIPFFLIMNSLYMLNIMFLLFMGLLAIDIIENLKYQDIKVSFHSPFASVYTIFIHLTLMIIFIFIILLSNITGYFLFGISTIVFFYYMNDTKIIFFLLFLSVSFLNFSMFYAIASLISLLIILFIIKNPELRNVKIVRVKSYLFYLVYPLHMAVIFMINY